MENNLKGMPLSIRIIHFTSLIFILAGTFLIGSFIFLKTLQWTEGITIEEVSSMINGTSSHPLSRKAFLIAQSATAIISFILIPLFVIYFIYPELKIIFRLYRNSLPVLCFSAVIITLISLPVIAYLSDVNKIWIEHAGLSTGLKNWMISSEKEAEGLTKILAYYESPGGMIAGLLVIALLPAVGEELLFRGVTQLQLARIFNNTHLAIWTTGFLFSFIHFQFFGFIPRMFLGVLFGYMYHWSGTLLIPVIMHFTNNALTYYALNLYQQKKISIDLDSTKDIPLSSIVIAVFILIFLLVWFRIQCNTNSLKKIKFF